MYYIKNYRNGKTVVESEDLRKAFEFAFVLNEKEDVFITNNDEDESPCDSENPYLFEVGNWSHIFNTALVCGGNTNADLMEDDFTFTNYRKARRILNSDLYNAEEREVEDRIMNFMINMDENSCYWIWDDEREDKYNMFKNYKELVIYLAKNDCLI